ncbi:cytochrome c biogenesis protein [Marmoricola sp. OAE513]|uniref:cytochrome c biogenesis protein ResB n=1 Tax=Marmoricola sp. OAE513 TaxID=2817894 RepID=UPI001AEAD903
MSEQFENERDRKPEVAPLAPVEFLRWTWRQLTSMKTALILLFLLALGAVPGSVVPQDAVDSLEAARWRDAHPSLAPIYEKLGLFSVYSSPWFSAIYILLMISLVGCILPRTRVYWKALRARPPKTPGNLSRLPEYRSFTVEGEPEQVLERAKTLLGGYRTDVHDGSISAERGYLREAGNLVFHLSILIVLVGFATGSLFGFKGGVVVVEGGQFANVANQYDDFVPGRLFDASDLQPFSFAVEKFRVTYSTDEKEFGMASDFSADLAYQSDVDAATKRARISVNHPLDIDGTQIYLIGHGYAPQVTVKDGNGNIAYKGPVIFLPQDSTFLSDGVIKVPEAKPSQLGFGGLFFPTYATLRGQPSTVFPEAKSPLLSMFVYSGDLGLDSGIPQSVYSLDMSKLTQVKNAEGKDYRFSLRVGETAQLPDDLGSITFDGVSRFVKLQISKNPNEQVALAGMILALLGLLGSLFIRPRRVWIRVRREDGRTLVEVAGLHRSAGGDLTGEIDDLVAQLEDKA